MMQQTLRFDLDGRVIEFGLELDTNNSNDAYMYNIFKNGHCYEPEVAWVLAHVLQEGDFTIDVGANIGFFTLFMSKLVGITGMVFAGEPEISNLITLSHNIRLNNLSNVQVIERPFWRQEEKVTFYINSDSRGSHALFDPANWPDNVQSRANPKPIEMQATTIDALDISKERVKLIKIDTEGAEQRILEGAYDLLETCHPPFIIAELNPHGLAQSGCNNETLRAYMRQFGYDIFMLHGHDTIPSLVPEGTRIVHQNNVVVSNALFSTCADVSRAWPEILG